MKTGEKRAGALARWMPGLLALLLAAPALWLVARPGTWVGNGTDATSYQLPMRRLVRALWLSGELPAWNPYMLGGVPLLAGMQLGVFYPPNLLAVLLPPEQALDLLWSLHLAWLALGGFVLGNAVTRAPLGRMTAAGVTGAAALVAAGPTWGHAWPGHVSFVQAWAWTPWIAALALQATRAGHGRYVLGATGALAMQLLAGHPQVSYLGMTATMVVLLTCGLGARGPGATTPERPLVQRMATVVWVLAATLAGALALTAVQWWPTLQLAPLLNRSLATGEPLALSFSAPPHSLLTALAPTAFGGTGARLAGLSYHETVAHVGAAGLALALAAVLRLRFRHLALCGAAAFFALLSTGRYGPLMQPLLGWMPGLDAFRVPSRWVLPALLLIAVLAAETAGQWAAPSPQPTPTRRPVGAAMLGLLALGAVVLATGVSSSGGWWFDLLDQRQRAAAGLVEGTAAAVRLALYITAAAVSAAAAAAFAPQWRRPIGLGLAGWLVLEAVAFGAGHVGPQRDWSSDRLDWPAPAAQALREAVGHQRLATAARLRQANWGGAHGVRIAGGYETAVPALTNRWANHFAGRPQGRYAVNLQVHGPSPWLDRSAVSHLVRHRGDQQAARRFASWPVVKELPGDLTLHRNPRAMPRWQIADKVTVEADPVRTIGEVGSLPRDTVSLSRPLVHRPGAGGHIEMLRDGPGEVRLSVSTPVPAVVILRDTHLPGWRTTVDGNEARVARADGLFRAVEVPAGSHEVRWSYRAPGLFAGAALSLLAWLLLGGALWRLSRGRAEPDTGGAARLGAAQSERPA